MAEMSDRERLERLAREKEQARRQAEEERRRREADEQRRRAEADEADRRATEAVYDYARKTLTGFPLVPTELPLVVGRADSSKVLALQADGVPYATLSVNYWDEATDFRGEIQLAAARCRGGRYEVVDIDRTSAVNTFDELREKLLDVVSDMGRDYVAEAFRRFRVFHG